MDAATLAALPAPVQRYLAYTGADRAPAARFTRFRFEGEVRLPITGSARGVTRATPWMPTRGEQYEGDFEQVRAKTTVVDFHTAAPYPAKDASTAARQASN